MYRAALTGTWLGTTTGTGSVTATRMTSGWDWDTAVGTVGFWLGLERVHLLTTSGNYRLRLEWQENSTNYWFSTEYWSFYIDDEAAFYQLHVSGYVDGDDGRALWVRKFVIGCQTRAIPPAIPQSHPPRSSHCSQEPDADNKSKIASPSAAAV